MVESKIVFVKVETFNTFLVIIKTRIDHLDDEVGRNGEEAKKKNDDQHFEAELLEFVDELEPAAAATRTITTSTTSIGVANHNWSIRIQF